jgi:hypothetical protein
VFGIELPFFFIGRAHADDADRFCTQDDKHYGNYAADIFADAAPALVVGRQKQRFFEESFVEISEIQMMLFEIGETLRFIPKDLHEIIL